MRLQRTIFVGCLLVIGMTLLHRPAVAAEELRDILITLGEMEHASIAPLPDGWDLLEQHPEMSWNVTLDSSTKTQGQRSLRVHCASAPPYTAWSIRRITLVGQNGLKAGDRLELSADIRTGDMQNATVMLRIRSADAQGNALSTAEQTVTAANSSWQTYRASLVVPEGAERVSILIRAEFGRGGGWATFWVDNVRLTNGEKVQVPVVPRRVIRTFTYFRIHPDLYETARRFDIVVLHPVNWVLARPLRRYNPNIEVYAYFNSASTSSTLEGRWDPLDYHYVLNQRPQWFLVDSTGQRLTEKGYPQNYLVDIGDPELQQRWASRAIQIAQQYGFNGVYIDNMVRGLLSLQETMPTRYPDEGSYQSAQTSFLNRVSTQVKQAGLKVMANFGYAWREDEPPYNIWMQYVDAAMAENWVRGYWNDDYRLFTTFARYLWALDALQMHGTVKYLAQGRATENETEMQRFLLASALLNHDERTYFHTADARYQQDAHYLPDYEMVLGSPAERYTLVAGNTTTGGAFRRRFSQGLVLVNAHPTQPFRVNIDGQYIDANGTVYLPGDFELPPLRALILAKADSKLRISVHTSPSSRAPGQRVPVTVVVENVSTEQLQQVHLRLPLSPQLVYVAGSASHGGNYDVQRRTISWVIERLLPRESLSLAFEAILQ